LWKPHQQRAGTSPLYSGGDQHYVN
jgi:hypothetical protein